MSLREIFAGYLPRTQESFDDIWKTCEFTFDANILLDLYSAGPHLRKDLFTVWDMLSDRLFLTHQAGLEYYRRRADVVRKVRSTYESISSIADEVPAAFSDGASERLKAIFEKEKASLQQFIDKDPIESEINKIFEGKITAAIKDLHSAHAAIDARFASLIPPGFADVKKGDYRKYGDAILWLQILDRAKDFKKPIVFVTAEQKGDWWEVGEKGKIIGPRPELSVEMKTYADVSFHMYSLGGFINFAKKYLNLQSDFADKQTAQEVEKISADRRGQVKTFRDFMPQVNPNVYIVDGSPFSGFPHSVNQYYSPPISGSFFPQNHLYPQPNMIYHSGMLSPFENVDVIDNAAGYLQNILSSSSLARDPRLPSIYQAIEVLRNSASDNRSCIFAPTTEIDIEGQFSENPYDLENQPDIAPAAEAAYAPGELIVTDEHEPDGK